MPASSRDGVRRSIQTARLQPLLQTGLGVFDAGRGVEIREVTGVQPLDHAANSVETGIEKDRAEQRLQRVGENGRAIRSTRQGFAFAKEQTRAETQISSHCRQRLRAHQSRAPIRQPTLVNDATGVEQSADGQPKRGVAEKLKTLIVMRSVTAVGQRGIEQTAVAKGVTEAILK